MVGIKLVNTFRRPLEAQQMWAVGADKGEKTAFFNTFNGCSNLFLLVKNQHKLVAYNNSQVLELILSYHVLIS